MAKISGPLMSLDARGAIGERIIFNSGKTIKSAKRWHQPSGAPSSTQVLRRNRFALARDAWNALTAPQRLAYSEAAMPLQITGWNLYLKLNITGAGGATTWDGGATTWDGGATTWD